MAKILDMPKLSPTMEEGVLATWHKKEGDSIEVDDLLAEVETDKATMEFRAFDRGTLLKLLVGAGASVKLGQPVAILGAPGEDVSALVAGAGPAAAPGPAAAAPAPPAPAAAAKSNGGDRRDDDVAAETPRSPHSIARAEEPDAAGQPRPRAAAETLRPAARAAVVDRGNLLTRTE